MTEKWLLENNKVKQKEKEALSHGAEFHGGKWFQIKLVGRQAGVYG